MRAGSLSTFVVIGFLVAGGCGGDDSSEGASGTGGSQDSGVDGKAGQGGTSGTGATAGTGASAGTGATAATGGVAGAGATGGTSGTGGTAGSAGGGGVAGSSGQAGTAGTGTGGSAGSDASAGTGGVTGGTGGVGGSAGNDASAGTGGVTGGTGGTGATGGTSGTGGTGGTGLTGGTGGVGGSDASAGTGGATGGTGGVVEAGPCQPVTCQGKIYECGDCLDNDKDGKTDVGSDPDCLGPCHNAEDKFYGSIPGQAGPACTVDCYFDQDSGSGNDECGWTHKCDPLSVAPSYPPEHDSACAYDPNAKPPGTNQTCSQLQASQPQKCLDFCGPLTPNGCDCFGCCELPAQSGKYVWLGAEDSAGTGSCDLQSVGDPSKCPPCTPVKACLNTCQTCELCIGKPQLPPECSPKPDAGDGGSCPTPTCPDGIQACGTECLPKCPPTYFCLTGCCIREF